MKKITFLIISFLTIANCYSSVIEPEKKPQKTPTSKAPVVKLDDLLICDIAKIYAVNNLSAPDERSDSEATFRQLMQAKGKLRNEPENIEAFMTFKSLAQGGHTHSALELGTLCVRQDKIALAMRWYVYAFQLGW